MLYFTLDTNIYLHYHFFTDIDWLKLLKARQATLLVPMQVFDELEAKKYSSPDTRTKETAKKVSKKLASLIKNKEKLRNNIDVSVIDIPNDFDWAKSRLSQSSSDDRIIASLLVFQNCKPNARIVVVTNDSGFSLRINNRFEELELDDEYQLKVENEDTRKHNALMQEYQKIINARPKVGLVFRDTSNKELVLETKTIQPFDDNELRRKLADLKQELKYILEPPPPAAPVNPDNPFFELISTKQLLVNTAYNIMTPAIEDIDRYNVKVEQYINAYEEYIIEKYTYNLNRSLTFELGLKAINSGNSLANFIDIKLKFPDGFELIQEDDLPEPPEPPKQPRRPLSMYECISQGSNLNVWPGIMAPEIPKLDINNLIGSNQPTITIKKTNSYDVETHLESLNHHSEMEIEPFFVVFASVDAIKPFCIEYEIIVGNIPEPLSGKLNVRFV